MTAVRLDVNFFVYLCKQAFNEHSEHEEEVVMIYNGLNGSFY